MRSFRTRFAPSPTGPLHIGGVRTALYNYLLTSKITGQLVLRIEDTDRSRYVPEAEAYIVEALKWCGIRFDESPALGGPFGPYRQSERKSIYTEFTHRLIEFGHAYYAFDTPEEIEQMRQEAKSRGNHTPRYDHSIRGQMRNSLTLHSKEVQSLLSDGVPYTVRLKVNPGEAVAFEDEVRGEVRFSTDELDDKILLKADGMPTYHLANVVDDHLMEISHVIRGEEWLSSTPHHVLLYRSFGWEDDMPKFAHLPLILKPTGKGKLSKRDGQKFGFPVFPLQWKTSSERFDGFREAGFDPEALVNFLAFLGWNPGTEKEIFSMSELIHEFSVAHVVKSGARFDYDKAKWFNQQHISRKPLPELLKIVQPILAKHGIKRDKDFMSSYIALMRPRVENYHDFYEMGYYFFEEVRSYDRKPLKKKWKGEAPAHLVDLCNQLEALDEWNSDSIQDMVKSFIHSASLKFGDILPILRLALSGTTKGPDLFPMMALMGKKQVLERLSVAPGNFDKTLEEN